MKEGTKKKQPSIKLSLLVLSSIILILMVGITILDVDMHALLIIVLCVVCAVSFTLGFTFDELTEGMQNSLSQVMPAMMIFIMIGVIIGSWILSGTVPAIIYYGLKIITPRWFLPAGLLLCSITSLATGTSWGTAGTVGIALMGMGVGLGIPAPVVAGMVISGAYFGDKMSPISDTTNLSAAAAGADLYDHVKSMTYTTLPSYIIVLVIYTLMGFKYADGYINTEEINLIINTIGANFNMNPLVFIPMIVLFTLNIKRFPAVPAMIIGAFVAVIIAITLQGVSIKDALLALNYGYSNSSGVELVDTLLNRGGIQSMMWTFSLAFIAISLGGVLEHVGYLRVLMEGIIHRVNSPGWLSVLVIMSTTLANGALGEVYLSLILIGNLYRDVFKEKGIHPSMLSRFLEEGGTLTQVFVPWTTGAAFMASTLGVSTLEYAPYALLNYINPLVSMVFCFLGIYVFKETLPTGRKQIKKIENRKA